MADDISRRSACDRCRRQKIRCVRDSVDQPCERCQKSDAVCRTNQFAPIGGVKGPLRQSHTSLAAGSSNQTENFLPPQNAHLDDLLESLMTNAGDDSLTTTTVGNSLELSGSARGKMCPQSGEYHNHGAIDVWEGINLTNFQQGMDVCDTSFDEALHSMNASSQRENAVYDGQGSHRNGYWADEAHTLPRFPNVSDSTYQWSATREARRPSGQLEVQRKQADDSESNLPCASQIFDLHRRLMKTTDDYMARRRSDSNTIRATWLDAQAESSGSALSKRFMEALLIEAQGFLGILQNMQARNRETFATSRAVSLSPVDGARTPLSKTPTSPFSDGSENVNSRALDFQSSLAIVSCYAQTIEAFNNVFQDFLERLKRAGLQQSSALLDLMPEISIGNLQMSGQPVLQVQCLLRFSLSVLESIESLLGITSPVSNTNRSSLGLLRSAELQGLLGALFDQKDLAYEKADGTRAARVKHTIDQIQGLLNGV